MIFNLFDYALIFIFLGFILYTIVTSALKKQTTASFFRADGNIHWIKIGFALIAADMSMAYVIGGSGMGFDKGIAYGSYEWTASIAMIVVALYIFPKLMSLRILTLPEYLERRYDHRLRLIVSIIMISGIVLDGIASSFYSGALLLQGIFNLSESTITWFIWGCGIITMGIILSGGLAAMVKTDIFIVSLLLIGGILLLAFCFIKTDGFHNFIAASDGRMNSTLPANDNMLPWTHVFLGSLWILHLHYWAFNQVIVQTPLASNSLTHAQKGILLAATIKLIIPFMFLVPGIIGYEFFRDQISDPDRVFPLILREIVPAGFKGFILISFAGTIIAATNSMLNACATIFTNDIYKRYISPDISGRDMIKVSRVSVIVFITFACLLAPNLHHASHLFIYSQFIQSSISPVLVAIFIFGFYSPKTSARAALLSLGISIPVYLTLVNIFPETSTLTLAGINFLLTCLILGFTTLIQPLDMPIALTGKDTIRYERNLVVFIWSIFIFTLVAAIYIVLL